MESLRTRTSQVALVVKNPLVNTGDAGDGSLIPASGRSPGVGSCNPLQYSCLENSMDRGAWHATVQVSSVVQSCLTLWPHEPQHARPSCPWPTPGVHPNPCPLSGWCHPTISSSVVLFSSCLQSFPASGSFQMSRLFASDGQIIGVSASTSVLPMNTQDWSPLGWTGWISLQSQGLSRVFSNTTVQKHQFFSTQLSL